MGHSTVCKDRDVREREPIVRTYTDVLAIGLEVMYE